MSDIVSASLEKAAAESALIREQAQTMAMPADPVGWLSDAEARVAGLADSLPQKSIMLLDLKRARHALEIGDSLKYRTFLIHITRNWENAVHDKWVIEAENSIEASREEKRNAAKKSAEARGDNAKTVLEERDALVAAGVKPHKIASEIAARLKGTPFQIGATRIRQILKTDDKNKN